MISIEVIEDIEDSRLSAWNKLLDNSSHSLPFQQYEWVRTWWKNFAGDKDKLFIMLARKYNEPIGIAPLMYKKPPFLKFNIIKFIGTGYCDYFDFIIKVDEARDVIDGFINYIYNKFRTFELQIKNIFEDSFTYKILREKILFNSFNGKIYPEVTVPYIQLPETKEQFYLQTKRLLRVDVARRERRLKELGELVFRGCENLNEAKDALEDFFSLHIKKWEFVKGYSVYRFEQRRTFLRNLLDDLFDKKIINIYYLSLKDKKLAICFSFTKNRRLIYYTTAYDPAFAKYSPGKILVSKLINYAIDSQYREFDFGIGDEYYKTEWPYNIKQLYNIYIFPNKTTFSNIFIKYSRSIISNYFLYILPNLRKFRLAVYFWRWINRKRGQYRSHYNENA